MAGPPITVYAFCCFDLGGAVGDWRATLSALRAEWPDADRSAEFDDAWHTSYLMSHAPVLQLEECDRPLSLPRMSTQAPAKVDLKVFPTGVIGFRYALPMESGASVRDAYQLTVDFDNAYRLDYLGYLHEEYARLGLDSSLEVSDGPPSHIELTPTVERVRRAVAPVILRRPEFYVPTYVRNAIVVHSPPEGMSCREAIAELASEKGVNFSPDTLGGLVSEDPGDAARVRTWQDLLLASWEGYEVLVVSHDEARIDAAVQSLELAHEMGFLARAWVDILERSGIQDLRGRRYREDELQELEAEMLAMSSLEQLIGRSMIEVESVHVMFKDPLRLQLVEDFYKRFGVNQLRDLVGGRLGTIARHHSAISTVIDRGYQEATRRQGERLQLLFAGSVAASLTALIPATLSLGQSALPITILTWTLTVTLWTVAVLVARRLWPVVVQFREARGPWSLSATRKSETGATGSKRVS